MQDMLPGYQAGVQKYDNYDYTRGVLVLVGLKHPVPQV